MLVTAERGVTVERGCWLQKRGNSRKGMLVTAERGVTVERRCWLQQKDG